MKLVRVAWLMLGCLSGASWGWEDEYQRQQRLEAERRQKERDDALFERQQQRRWDAIEAQKRALNDIARAQDAAIQARLAEAQRSLAEHPLRVWGEGVSPALVARVRALIGAGQHPSVAISPSGGYVIHWNLTEYECVEAPEALCQLLADIVAKKKWIHSVSFSRTGGWLVQHDLNVFSWGGLDATRGRYLHEAHALVKGPLDAALVGDGVFLRGDKQLAATGLSPEVARVLENSTLRVESVSVGPDSWVLLRSDGKNVQWSGIPDRLARVLTRAYRTRQVLLTPSGGWLVIGQ